MKVELFHKSIAREPDGVQKRSGREMGTMANNLLTDDEVKRLMGSVLEEEDVKNARMAISSGSAKGDGYLSFLTRVDVKGDNKDMHVVIKCAPKADEFRKLAPIVKVYNREIYMYDVILPAFAEFQRERNVERPFAATAKCYKTCVEEREECLVLENIKERGFGLWNRMEYMNDDHITMVFKHYGKLHACSHAMHDQNPKLFHSLTKDLDEVFKKETMNPEVYKMFTMCSERLVELFCEKAENDVLEAVKRFNEAIMEYFTFLETNPGDHPVVCHGDCWCNNMMFKYADKTNPKKPTELCLLDFQLSKLGSPVIDLSYFFYVSAPKPMLDKLDHYLKIYYASYCEHMKALGSNGEKIFPFEALMREWKTYCKFGFFMALMVVRAMLRDVDEIVDFTDFSENVELMPEFFEKGCRNDKIVNERLKNLTLHLHENGFI